MLSSKTIKRPRKVLELNIKGTLGKRLLTPQQLVLIEHLFLASRVGSLEELSANVRDIPFYLQFSIRW